MTVIALVLIVFCLGIIIIGVFIPHSVKVGQLPTTLGSKTSDDSLSITLASDSDVATETTLSSLSNKLPSSLGPKTGDTSLSVVQGTATSFLVQPIPSMIDAFSRSRISFPYTLFFDTSEYGLNLLKWETQAVGSGAFSFVPFTSAVTISTGGTASGASFIRQSRYFSRYQPGKSQFITMTFCFSEAVSNAYSAVGYFDDENGFYLQYDESGLTINERSNVTGTPITTSINQSNWNIDPLNGSGPSGITIDPTNIQILVIDLQWLGGGRVRVGFDITGERIFAHEFLHANLIRNAYTTSGSLPVRYEVTNTGISVGTQTMKTLCASVMSEGGSEPLTEPSFSAANGVTDKAIASGTLTPILSIRSRATIYADDNMPNRGHIRVLYVSIMNTGGANPIYFQAMMNPALTGASFSNVNIAESMAMFDTSATAATGGSIIVSGYVPAAASGRGDIEGNSWTQDLPMVTTALGGIQDTLTVMCAGMGGVSTAVATIQWREIY
jgi:hypothetical protein